MPPATPFPFSDPQAALAAKYFIEGSRLDDGDERKMEDAAAAYRRALVIDPDLVPAIVNLANIHYAQDELIEAQALYERAIGLDPDCFEAHFNLGNIHHDLGRYDEALVCYRDAVALNPGYPDAHFYLAVTLEKTGHSPEAKPHWRTYQELAPDGEWIELAREFSSRRLKIADADCDHGRDCDVLDTELLRSRLQSPASVVVPLASSRASSACGGACRTRTPGTTSPA